jgi:hypothetical protein
MSDEAISLVALFDHEWGKASNFRNLYQDCADLMFPRENQIVAKREPGSEITQYLIDPTGVLAAQEMASGLSINLFPPGQKWYNVVMSDAALNENDDVKKALGMITERSHEKRANSNFMLQANETLLSLAVFGTGNLFSEYLPGEGLNYRDYDIGSYVFTENSKGRVDGMMMEFPYTARQAVQEFGKDAGETALKKNAEVKTQNDILKFIWIVRKRETASNKTTAENMSYGSTFISRDDKEIVKKSGFHEFPFQVPRWTRSSGEIWGRGQGTFAVGAVRALQTEKKDLIECGNLHNNPPQEVLEHYEGEVLVSPGDLNHVLERGTIAAMDRGALGNFPISKDLLEMEREEVKKIFYNDVFVQLRDLKGDRRTTMEIRARLAEGLQRLGPPIGRLQEEWLTPLVVRDIMMLQRNGAFGELPPEMQGASFKIEYIGRLALELQSAKSMGWLQWVSEGAEIEPIIPGTLDNVDIDGGYRRRGMALGVSVDDMASLEEVAQKRQERAAQQQAQMMAEMAAKAGQAYQGATKAPEEGSAAEALMGG